MTLVMDRVRYEYSEEKTVFESERGRSKGLSNARIRGEKDPV